jgi:hypothetical protein
MKIKAFYEKENLFLQSPMSNVQNPPFVQSASFRGNLSRPLLKGEECFVQSPESIFWWKPLPTSPERRGDSFHA